MSFEFGVLESRFLRLEPLGAAHKEELRAACAADPDIWAQAYSLSMLGDHFEANWTKLTGGAMTGAGGDQAYAVVVDGVCVGMTCLLRIDLANGTAEIGATYYRPDMRGGPVNPAAKRLLLAHGFDSGLGRVYLCVDAVNARSRAAVLKLGAVQEGILRRDRVVWTGRLRDTVVFSVLDHEWPAVRAHLDARLAAYC
jgi:RimJ/RimL family protein N-acetyltransferase